MSVVPAAPRPRRPGGNGKWSPQPAVL